jgi:hypothetical protein
MIRYTSQINVKLGINDKICKLDIGMATCWIWGNIEKRVDISTLCSDISAPFGMEILLFGDKISLL